MGVFELFLDWFVRPVVEWVGSFISQAMFLTSFQAVFHVEEVCGIGEDVLLGMNTFLIIFAGGLLTLKLLYKLFNVYVAGVDGDSSVSPLEYAKSYVKGLVVMLTFTVAYQWIMDVAGDLTQNLIDIIGSGGWESTGIFLPTSFTFDLIFILIYAIFIIIVLVNCFMNGIRMLVLRLILPVSCVGLIDNDNGIYAVVMKKLFQTAATAVVQICLVQLSLLPMKMGGAASFTFFPYILAIGILAYSLKVASDMNEIFLTGAATGAGQKMSALGRGVQAVAGFIGKK